MYGSRTLHVRHQSLIVESRLKLAKAGQRISPVVRNMDAKVCVTHSQWIHRGSVGRPVSFENVFDHGRVANQSSTHP